MADNIKTVKVKVEVDEAPLKSLKQQFIEAKKEVDKLAGAETVDQAKLDAAILKMSQLKDSMIDVNEQVGILTAGSKFEILSNNIGDVAGKIASLDFEGANESAQRLIKNSKNITFNDAIGAVKNLGSTFVSLGKALLTNPLFLLASVITLLVAGIVSFMKKIGLLQKAMEMIGGAIDYVIGLFKKLTDWIGISNFAAQDAAEATAKAYEESAARQSKASESVIQSIDNKIRMAKLEGKDVTELERQKRRELEETAKIQMKADQARFKAALLNKELTKEEIADIKEKARVSRLAYQQTIADTKYFEAELKKTKADEKKKEAEDNKKTLEANRKTNESNRQKNEAKRKAYEQARLQATRTIRDLEIESMQAGIDKEIAINNEKYKRLIEDTKNSETLLATEKASIIKQYEDLQKAGEAKVREEDRKKKQEEQISAQKEYNQMIFDINASAIDKEISTINDNSSKRLDALKKQLTDGLITKEQFDAAEVALEAEKQNQLKALTGFEDAEMEPIAAAKKEANDKLAIQTEYLNNKLITEQEFADRKAQIDKELADKIKALDDEVLQKRKENVSNYLNIASQGISAISSLMEASMENELKGAEGNEAKQEEIRKKGFEKNKKLQIASAFVNMAQGILAATASPFPLNIAMPAIAAATGIANIAKIKATTYQGGGSTSSSASASSPSGSEITGRMGPSFNFQGTGGGANNVSAGGGSQTITIENKVSISETEITDKQKTVANLTNSAKL